MKNKKSLIIIVIILALIVGIIAFVYKNKTDSISAANNTQIYTNTQYDFSFTFTNLWKEYKTQTDERGDILFCVLMNNTTFLNKQNYSCLFKLIVADRGAWEKEAGPCLKDRNAQAMCDWVDNVLGKNDKYVFYFATVQDYSPEQKPYLDEIGSILKTFKFVR